MRQILCDADAAGAEVAQYEAFGPRPGQGLDLCGHHAREFAKVMPEGWAILTLDDHRLAMLQVVQDGENYVSELFDAVSEQVQQQADQERWELRRKFRFFASSEDGHEYAKPEFPMTPMRRPTEEQQ